MGSDYYAYTVIGVKASKYAKEKRTIVQVQQVVTEGYSYSQKDAKKVFDTEGKPVMENVCLRYFEFLGKNYMRNVRKEYADKITIPLEDTDFREVLAEAGLQWFSYNYETVYSGDIIGMKITEDDMNQDGVAQDKLPELFVEAKRRLVAMGITEEPKLYARFYHSN